MFADVPRLLFRVQKRSEDRLACRHSGDLQESDFFSYIKDRKACAVSCQVTVQRGDVWLNRFKRRHYQPEPAVTALDMFVH
jgi:hypothetical protein